jgi:Skp family chaperone for outer membrane proteins
LSFLVVAFTSGCNDKTAQEAPPAATGTLDLDRVADEIGLNAKYQEYVLAYRDRLKTKLEEALLPLQKDVDKLQRELRDELDAIPLAERAKSDWVAPASIEQLYRRLVEKQQQMQAEGQASDAKLQDYDRKMKQDFQAAIQPALAIICESKGVRLLIPRGAGIFCHPDADLTNALIAQLKANPIPPLVAPPGDS